MQPSHLTICFLLLLINSGFMYLPPLSGNQQPLHQRSTFTFYECPEKLLPRHQKRAIAGRADNGGNDIWLASTPTILARVSEDNSRDCKMSTQLGDN